MRIIETVAELQAQSLAWRLAREQVGFVPTMGALHAGHISLVTAARAANRRVIASVFVNPTQFNDAADLDSYPRDFDGDARMLRDAGVDAVFHPGVAEMYPAGGPATRVVPGAAATGFEGADRPGHFEGVATVVARLFNAALPDRAYFGQKDAQQLAVIRALTRDLGFPIEIVGCPTVREADGLAMSSRNGRLDVAQREHALALVRALGTAQREFAAGARDPLAFGRNLEAALAGAPAVKLDYAGIVNPETFAVPAIVGPGDLAVVAAQVGAVRLIDNAAIGATDLIKYAAIESPRLVLLTQPAPPQGVMTWNA
jgi:pantoate--beta-alanine ligase